MIYLHFVSGSPPYNIHADKHVVETQEIGTIYRAPDWSPSGIDNTDTSLRN